VLRRWVGMRKVPQDTSKAGWRSTRPLFVFEPQWVAQTKEMIQAPRKE